MTPTPTPPPNPSGKPVVIVTGSSGLLGGRVIDELRHDYQVIGFDRDGEPQPPREVECICVDLTIDDSVARGVDRVQYAYGDNVAAVVHLAAYYDFSGRPSDLYDKVTVEGTARLLRELHRLNTQRFIFSSTMLVHQPTEPGEPITEDSPIEAKWDYPESKVRTEQVIHEQRDDINATILRIAGVYTDDCDSIPLSQQIRRILEQRITSKVYPGDTSHGQAFVHLDDAISAIRAAVDRRHQIGPFEPYLIGEESVASYHQLQRALARLLHNDHDWETHTIPKTLAEAGAWVQDNLPAMEKPFIKPWMIDLADDHYEIDTTKARRDLGWSPKHNVLNTLPRMIEALRRDPSAWYQRHNLGDFDHYHAPSLHPAHLEV